MNTIDTFESTETIESNSSAPKGETVAQSLLKKAGHNPQLIGVPFQPPAVSASIARMTDFVLDKSIRKQVEPLVAKFNRADAGIRASTRAEANKKFHELHDGMVATCTTEGVGIGRAVSREEILADYELRMNAFKEAMRKICVEVHDLLVPELLRAAQLADDLAKEIQAQEEAVYTQLSLAPYRIGYPTLAIMKVAEGLRSYAAKGHGTHRPQDLLRLLTPA